MRRKMLFLTCGLLAAGLLQATASDLLAGGRNDHFESRRRSAELRRQQAMQQPELRPWGGPTTSRQFWTPVQQHHHVLRVPHGAFLVPGQYRWFAGRLIYVPPHWVGSPHPHLHLSGPQQIHIEHRHIVK